MSNTQSKPILQRAVGAIFLLALIGLVAILLLQPSDHLPDSTAKNSKPQQPTISITANDNKPSTSSNDNLEPALILESTTDVDVVDTDSTTAPTEVIGEDIWQSVEQQTQEEIQAAKPILVASSEPSTQEASKPKVDTPKTQASQTTPKAETTKPETVKPKVEAPKLELIADSEKTTTSKPSAQATPKADASGKWYVQIGAFGNAANAQKLVNQYKQQGYNVRIQKDNNLNRVQIGPFSTKKDAEKVQAKTKTQSLNPAVIHLP